MPDDRSRHRPPDPFSCTVRSEGGRAWISPAGELDLDTVDDVRREIAAARERGWTDVVLDLRGLTFMDSTGLRLVIEADAAARGDGFRFAIVPGSQAADRLFRLTGLEGRFTEVDPPREA